MVSFLVQIIPIGQDFIEIGNISNLSGGNENIIEANEEAVPSVRISCDVLGNEVLCALHCISRGFRGGYCNSKKVCVCRR